MIDRRPEPPPNPVVDEIRAIRKAISDEHGNDVHRLSEELRALQESPELRDRIVRRRRDPDGAARRLA